MAPVDAEGEHDGALGDAPQVRIQDREGAPLRDLAEEVRGDDVDAGEGESLLKGVGCYRLEGRGAQLFERVEGDYFTVLGLPLVPLLGALRQHGIVAT